MSQKAITINPILPSTKQDWTDLNRDGRKMNKILNMCYTRITPRTVKGQKKVLPADDIILGYIAAICRLTHEKTNLVTTVLGVKQALEEYKKNGK